MPATMHAEGEDADRLLAMMISDGVPLPRSAILDAVQQPRWAAAGGVHDWRKYVPPSMREVWDSLPLPARLCVFETAELTALDEEVGAAMVTGAAR